MNIDVKKILPKDPSAFSGFRLVRILLAIYMMVIVIRSCIHFFASDGGANSIAGIDISVEGGDNIVAIFHQWGATQLLLVLLLYVLYFRYPGLTPLIALTLAIEPMVSLGRPQISMGDDGWTAYTIDRQPAAHFEHTVAVHEDRTEVLTSHEEIEKNYSYKWRNKSR